MNVLQFTSKLRREVGIKFDWSVDWLFDCRLFEETIWGEFWVDKGKVLDEVEVVVDLVEALFEIRQRLPLIS